MSKGRTRFLDEFMAEPIALAGCPGIIITRHEAYRFFVDRCGMSPRERGYGSAEHLSFGRKMSDQPLTDLSQPWVERVMEQIANG